MANINSKIINLAIFLRNGKSEWVRARTEEKKEDIPRETQKNKNNGNENEKGKK